MKKSTGSDSLRRVISTGDGGGNRWFFYNNFGLLTTVSNAYGAVQTIVFRSLTPS